MGGLLILILRNLGVTSEILEAFCSNVDHRELCVRSGSNSKLDSSGNEMTRTKNSLISKKSSLFPNIISLLVAQGISQKVAAAQPFLCQIWGSRASKSRNSL
jgi:hypothetical protein